MDLLTAMENRHSVRHYRDKRIEGEVLEQLEQTIAQCNEQGALDIQLCVDEPEAFSGMMARYGKFRNVKNYIALVGPKNDMLEEKCGYYGEKIVLEAQRLGLNTCWVAMTYSKSKSKRVIKVGPGQKLLMIIAIGYGETPGVPHKSKAMSELYRVEGEMPEWFQRGVQAAMLAPTAVNQQKFCFTLMQDNRVQATPGNGFYVKVDLGIVKYHFEVAAGNDVWQWK